MENNDNRSNLTMLEQLKQVTDMQMKEVDKLVYNICLNPRLNMLMNKNNLSEEAIAYEFYELKKEFKQYFDHEKNNHQYDL